MIRLCEHCKQGPELNVYGCTGEIHKKFRDLEDARHKWDIVNREQAENHQAHIKCLKRIIDALEEELYLIRKKS